MQLLGVVHTCCRVFMEGWKKGGSSPVSASCLNQSWCMDWLQRHEGKAALKKDRELNLAFCFYNGKIPTHLGKKNNNFQRTFWVFKNYRPHVGNVRKHELQSEILLFLSMVKNKVCVFSTCLFEVALVVCRSSQHLREVALFMQAEQVWAAFLGQLHFMQWSKQFLAELNPTYVTCYCPWITLGKMLHVYPLPNSSFFLLSVFLHWDCLVLSYIEFSLSRFT